MHYLSLIYFVKQAVRVSGVFIAHHRELTMYICNKWYVLYVLFD
jgi:hypothetical protein